MEEAPDIEIEHPWPCLSKQLEVVERKKDSFILGFHYVSNVFFAHPVNSKPCGFHLLYVVLMMISNDISTRYLKLSNIVFRVVLVGFFYL